MIKQPKFTDEVYQMYREKLEVIGFLRGKGSISKNIFYKELCKGFSGRIGLNVTSRTRGGYQVVNIYPIIGIHDEELEKTLSKIMGLKPHIYTPPTCGRPLGYISPESTYV
ncbi:MAG TPA: hypothetical protein PLI09_14335, partial [Candidatus Hydrogenedentes bacterium]|nr:hypothetical protein [Candidatus Hydrogenedentota bacterium]